MEQAKPVRLALVGYGYWGPNLARNFHQLEGAELAYVVDANPAALEKAQRLYGCVTATDVGVALADASVDADRDCHAGSYAFCLGAAGLAGRQACLCRKTVDNGSGRRARR